MNTRDHRKTLLMVDAYREDQKSDFARVIHYAKKYSAEVFQIQITTLPTIFLNSMQHSRPISPVVLSGGGFWGGKDPQIPALKTPNPQIPT